MKLIDEINECFDGAEAAEDEQSNIAPLTLLSFFFPSSLFENGRGEEKRREEEHWRRNGSGMKWSWVALSLSGLVAVGPPQRSAKKRKQQQTNFTEWNVFVGSLFCFCWRNETKAREEKSWGSENKPNNSWINEEKLNLFDFSLLIVNWVGYERTAPICRREIDSIAR